MILLRRFDSQFNYGDHGACICTIICYRMAKLFLDARNQNNTQTKVLALLTAEEVHGIMMRSAHFYGGTAFAKTKGLMGMFDILRLIPLDAQKYSSLEFAGLLLSRCSEVTLLDEGDDNDLMLMSLEDLLKKLQNRTGGPVALITTFDDHTIVFLSPEQGTLLMFDPAPAALYDISGGTTRQHQAIYKKKMQPYSATLISSSLIVAVSC